ncbi:MAG: hypothetical protein GX051_02340 [Clostridiales bacterium]|nr:hypothetical protein [Clostridiales bacterium]
MSNALTTDVYLLDSGFKKFLAVIGGACLMGSMWRIRGDHGYGGFWGMLVVAAAMCLYIFALWGFRKKANHEFMLFTVLLFAVTNGGWGTLNSQITGLLDSSAKFPGEEAVRYIEINPASGVVIMLLLGFGWAPLFAFMMAQFFSNKEYKIKDTVLVTVLYYVVQIVMKATLAHPILKLICPQAVELFEQGSADKNMSVWLLYLKHFDDASFAKKIPGGRNYFTSVEIIACAIAALAICLFLIFKYRDKIAARLSFGICSAFAAGITVADLIMFFGGGGYRGTQFEVPKWLEVYNWNLWEYFTGFITGGLIMLILVKIPKSQLFAQNQSSGFSLSGFDRRVKFIVYFLLFSLAYGAALVVPLAVRLEDFEINGVMVNPDGLVPETLTYIVAGVAAAAIIFALLYRNLFKRGLDTPSAVPIQAFCCVALPCYLGICYILYYFTGNAYALSAEMSPVTTVMTASLPVFGLCYTGIITFGRKNHKSF